MRINQYVTRVAIIYAPSRPEERVIREIDAGIQSGADALVLGSYPCLSIGFVDPRTYDCEFPLSNAFAVSKKITESVGKLDKNLGCLAAYELKKRIEAVGGKVCFAGDLLLSCHEQDSANITDCLLSSILLDAKYGNRTNWKRAVTKLVGVLKKEPGFGDHSRKALLLKMPLFLLRALWYRTVGHSKMQGYTSVDFSEIQKRGKYTASVAVHDAPLVSVVIRTRHRPEVLRKTLESLRYQAYSNVEYILIEDGEPQAKRMVEEEFSDLNIKYHATIHNIGRSRAANLGFSMANGKYINMLDDDDYLYPEHLYAGVMTAESGQYDMVFLQSLALLTTVKDNELYEYDINEVHFMNFPRIDPFTMVETCLTPNNGVLFRKSLYEELGGMREELDAHEDWAMWLKFMTKAKWSVVPYATCCFVNPYSAEERAKRDEQYAPFDGMQYDDPLLRYRTSSEDIKAYYRGFINDWHCLLELDRLDEELEKSCKKHHVAIGDSTEGQLNALLNKIKAEESMELSAEELLSFYRLLIVKLGEMTSSERSAFLETEYRNMCIRQ